MLRQVWRRGPLAIYSQALGGEIVAYEVYVVRVRPAMELKGKLYPRREVIPRNEEWGRRAWTCPTIEEAHRRCGEIDHASSREERLVSRMDA